jgi:sulfide:quinone oxidoreductase
MSGPMDGLPHGEQLLGMFMRKEGSEALVSVGIDHIDQGAAVLASGETIPFSFGMVVSPFLGQDFLADADSLADEKNNSWPSHGTAPCRTRSPTHRT